MMTSCEFFVLRWPQENQKRGWGTTNNNEMLHLLLYRQVENSQLTHIYVQFCFGIEDRGSIYYFVTTDGKRHMKANKGSA